MKHKLSYLDRWTKPAEDMTPLGKGTMWHLVMETHYHTLMAAQEAKNEPAFKELDVLGMAINNVNRLLDQAEFQGTDPQLIQLMRWMYAGHIQTYGVQPEWTILAVEHTLIVPLGEGFNIKTKVDLVVQLENGRILLVDHKSCGDLPTERDYDWDDQFGLYTWALRKAGKRVWQSLHSAARTKQNQGDILKPGDDGYKASMKPQPLSGRFKHTWLNRTDAELECLAEEALATCKEAYARTFWQRHPDTRMCAWACSFTEACLYGRRNNDNNKTVQMLRSTGWEQDFQRH